MADSYDRVRPGPPQQALDWLVPAGCEVAVDLAAGTGLFTRALFGRAARVVAVEPDERMREVLAERSPGADVRAGWAEAMPLPDASADAVFVSTAWHWFDPARAVPEIARVLRPGGRLGVIWTSRDREEDWVAELDLLRLPGVSGPDQGPAQQRTASGVRARLDRHHSVRLPPGADFHGQEVASFGFTRTISVDGVLEWLTTNSEFITATAAERAAGLASCRTALAARADSAGDLVMPMRSWCWRAQRSLLSGSSKDENESAMSWQVTASPTISVWERTTAEHTAISRGILPSRPITAARAMGDRRTPRRTPSNRPGHSGGATASG